MPRIVFWHLAMPCAPTLVATVRYCGIRCVSQQLDRRRDIHASGSVQTIFDNRISPRKAILHKQTHRKGEVRDPSPWNVAQTGIRCVSQQLYRRRDIHASGSVQTIFDNRTSRAKRFCTNKPIAKGRRETPPLGMFPILGFAAFRSNSTAGRTSTQVALSKRSLTIGHPAQSDFAQTNPSRRKARDPSRAMFPVPQLSDIGIRSV